MPVSRFLVDPEFSDHCHAHADTTISPHHLAKCGVSFGGENSLVVGQVRLQVTRVN